MLLTVHNLPSNTRYSDVKQLLEEQCGLTELILDNMTNEGSRKKVTVGVSDEVEAAILVRKINGLFYGGEQLYVEDVRKKWKQEQPFRTSMLFNNNQLQMQLGNVAATSMDLMQQTVTPQRMSLQSQMPNYGTVGGLNFQQSNYNQNLDLVSYPIPNQNIAQYRQPSPGPSGYQTSSYVHNQSNRNVSINPWQDDSQLQSNSVWNSYEGYSEPSYNNEDHRAPRRSNWENNSRSDPNSYHRRSPNRNSDRGNSSGRYFQQNEPVARQSNNSNINQQYQPRNADRNSSYDSRTKPSRQEIRDRPMQSSRDTGHSNTRGASFGDRDRRAPDNRTHNVRSSDRNVPVQPTKFNSRSNPTPIQKNLPGQSEPRLLARVYTWRCQVASQIAKEILAKHIHSGETDLVEKSLKLIIRNKLNILFAGKVGVSITDMHDIYRKQFPKRMDAELLEEAVRMAQVSEKEAYAASCGPSNSFGENRAPLEFDSTGKAIKRRLPDEKPVIPSKRPNIQSRDAFPKPIQRDTKYPSPAVKKTDAPTYTVAKPYTHKSQFMGVLNEEMKIIENICRQACSDPSTPEEESICERMNSQVISELKKTISISATKRLLNMTTGLMVRLIYTYKPPIRNNLNAFLKQYGVAVCNKVPKKNMFVALCSSFEGYDRLLALNSIVVDGVTLIIKSTYLSKRPTKKKANKLRPLKPIKKDINPDLIDPLADECDDFKKPKAEITFEEMDQADMKLENLAQIDDVANIKEEDLEDYPLY